MEVDDCPSTSHVEPNSSDDDDDHHENLSTEEICLKIKTFRNLCFGNKINVSNAFDIDMIGYFYSWLEKKKSSIFVESHDVTSFQEISDYLEASAKVYSYRVDNLTETTSKLVEQFKSLNYNKKTAKIDDNNAPKTYKSKRQKIMLTTSDKLRRRPNENEISINPVLINQKISGFDCNELFSTNRPSHHLKSLYFNKSLTEEMKTTIDEKKEYDEKKHDNEKIEVDKSFFQMMDKISQGAICPEFKGFVAKRDIVDKIDNSNDHQLNGIEYRFDPNDYQNNLDDSTCIEPDNNELDSNPKDKDTTVLDGLLKCIDNVDRDYSFFNPKLLANWKGPKAWKTQAMIKALKSCTQNERKEIISNTDDNIAESTQENLKQPKSCKKRNKVKNDKVVINWLDLSQVDEILKPKVVGKEKMLPRTLQKWDPLHNISETQSIIVNVNYKFQFLQYYEIKPDWWINYNDQEEGNYSEDLNSYQNINDCNESIAEPSEPMEIDCEDSELLKNKNDDELAPFDVSKELTSNDDIIADIKTESRMDIAELKKEISNIIDEECVETGHNNEWSSKLSFLNLLIKLRINERDGLSIPIVYVGLLHLANERGLKLYQEHCTINDMEETFIVKPMKTN
ncbi:condensin complex subunit 2-like [Melanaphis sacchari]|uniref:condensin complex subunit 2-like n=1 Tax=Melanaphis sacchari TaxID=742174 RepID=UPI000DC1320E|nr:condensin complex subunit 2-like [Melanaphis sacchari]